MKVKVPDLLAIVCALVLPASARAQSQSVTLKDLVGAWAKGPGINDTLFIMVDSTFITSGYTGNMYPFLPVNYLRGDTISLTKSESSAACRGERLGFCGEPGYKVTLKGQELTLTSLGETSSWHSGTYTRIDAQAYGRSPEERAAPPEP